MYFNKNKNNQNTTTNNNNKEKIDKAKMAKEIESITLRLELQFN